MSFRGVLSLFFVALFIQNSSEASSTLDLNREASALRSGYSIRLLKPLPRRNSGCATLFRNGKVLESCDANYGFNPKTEGVYRTYCEWNLNTHYQKYNSAKWLDSYFNPNLITITEAKAGYKITGNYDNIWDRMRSAESILVRWIEIEFNDQISGSTLGSLKCYPSFLREYTSQDYKLLGQANYFHNKSAAENNAKIKSGISIQDILDQLRGYIEIVKN